jgi:hypothetical protein
MRNLISFFLLIFILVFASFRCNKNFETCDEVMCTADFRMITIDIKDASGNPYAPDKVETKFGNSIINSSNAPSVPLSSSFTIVDDNNMKDFGYNTTNEVEFYVYKNNQVVYSSTFSIKTDCCHVEKVNGDNQIIIQ